MAARIRRCEEDDMGDVEHYPHGTFSWIDLGTPDVAGARAFYGELLGWTFEDTPAGDGSAYTLCRLDGKLVTGIHEHPEAEGAAWSSYLKVDDADAAATRARELGAEVLLEPFEIPGTARMALIRDPVGAVVSLWAPVGSDGAEYVNDVGAWGWNELVTPDIEAAKVFYGELVGWRAQDVPGRVRRAGFELGNLLAGGIHAPVPGEGDEPRWTVSFSVADAIASAELAESLGGRVVIPPTDIPMGRFCVVTDPAGAAFTLAAVPGGPLRGVDGS
jgi:uncharacterized protein